MCRANWCLSVFLLTGYFQVSKQIHLRKPLAVIVQTFLYTSAILLTQACLLLIHPTEGIEAVFAPSELAETLYTSLLPVFNGTYWFITAYVLMMIVSPYLNIILHHSTRKSSLQLIGILLLVSLMPIASLASLFWTTGVYAITGYLVGGWIRLYGETSVVYRSMSCWGSLLLGILSYAVLLTFIYIAIRFGVWDWLRTPTRYVFGTVPAVELVAAVAIFMSVMKTPSMNGALIARYVMPMSGSVFGVYLIHENPYIKANLWPLLTRLLPVPDGMMSVVVLTVTMTVVLFIVLTLCAFMYDTVIVKPVQRLLKLR